MRIFVTGTDTGVGKTLVSCALVRAARMAGFKACGAKPIESGCVIEKAGLQPVDAITLATASAVDWLVNECVFRFAEPVAPGVAAADAGVDIDLSSIDEIVVRLEQAFSDLVLIEGAGGLLVPLGRGRSIADLVRRLEAHLVVVGRGGLGTINHTLLTLEVAQARGLRVAGFVLSCERPDLDPSFVQRNRDEIERASGISCLGVLPWLDELTPSAVATAGLPLWERLGRAVHDDGPSPVPGLVRDANRSLG